MKSRSTIFCLVLCAILMSAFAPLSFKVLNVQAYNGSSTINERSLYNETNTYNIENSCFDGNNFIATYEPSILSNSKFRYKLKYDLTQKNSNTVMDYPQITVLTPGLGSQAGVWSNVYNDDMKEYLFAYDSQSLIAKLTDFAGGVKDFFSKKTN